MFRADVAVVSASIIALILVAVPPISPVPHAQAYEPRGELTARGCILIDGNDAFTAANGVVGGNGTADDPYIIEKWRIPSPEPTPPCNPNDGFIYLVTKGIWIRDTDRHFVIRDVLMEGVSIDFGHQGILLDNVTNGRVENATVALRVFTADITTGIQVQLAEDVTLTGNTVAQSIVVESSSDIVVTDSAFSETSLGIGNSERVIVGGNRFAGGGVILRGGSVEHFTSHTIASDNLVNGKEISYHKNCHDRQILGVEVGQVLIANCSDVTVAGLTIEDTVIGIDLAYVSGARLSGNTVRNVTTGISLDHADNITMAQNVIAHGFFGLFVWEAADLLILHNDISFSDVAGIFVYRTTHSTVQGNNLSGNYPGLWLWSSDDLLVHQNNFLANRVQAFTTETSAARWDAGYPGGGNYWSDYQGIDSCSGPLGEVCPDSDGLGDTPYEVQAGRAADRYPLMEPYGPLNAAPVARLTVSLSEVGVPYVVTLDASASSDLEDPPSLLEVRWDWEDDGVWDTDWTTDKVAQRLYTEIVPGPVRLQVRDTRGFTNTTVRPVPVLSPPEIVHTPIMSAVVLQAIPITVTVDADVGISEVLLHYQFEGSAEYTIIPMIAEAGGVYTAEIPAPTQGGMIRYFISATDLGGNEVRDPPTGAYQVAIRGKASPLGAHSLLAISVLGVAVVVALYGLFGVWRGGRTRRP